MKRSASQAITTKQSKTQIRHKPRLTRLYRRNGLGFSYDSSTKTLSIYINGNFEKSTTISTDPPTTGNQYVSIGASDGLTAANKYNGYVSTAMIYNRALSAAEVAQNFNAQRGRYGI